MVEFSSKAMHAFRHSSYFKVTSRQAEPSQLRILIVLIHRNSSLRDEKSVSRYFLLLAKIPNCSEKNGQEKMLSQEAWLRLYQKLVKANFSCRGIACLSQYFLNCMAMHICQAEVPPLKFECQPLMVNSQAVEDRCVQVMNFHGILRDVVTEIIGFADAIPRFDAAAREPNRKTARMVVASVIRLREVALGIDGSPEFAPPEDECVLQ